MVQDRIRLKFYKIGRMKYISHLDLIRTMTGALGRAKIPLYYTEGYNPRPKMVFSMPLSVGCESKCEFLDIKLNSPVEESELLSRLNEQFPPDMQFTDCYVRERDFSEIAYAEYDMVIYGDFTVNETEAALKGEIPVIKKSKKGMVESDISKGIVSYTLSETEGGIHININLSASADNYVKPTNLLTGLSVKLQKEIDDYDMMRVCVYDADGKEFV